MKKTFNLSHPKHKPARVIDLLKSEVRKYIKRERKQLLPEGSDFWAMECQFGFAEDKPVVIHESELNKFIDQAVEKACETVYIEIVAKPASRTKKAKVEVTDTEA